MNTLMNGMMIAAKSGGVTTSSAANGIMSNLITIAVTVGGGLLALFLIMSIVKDGLEYSKGSSTGSIWKIIGKATFLIFCIGLIIIAANWEDLGQKAQGVGEKGLDAIERGATEVLE